MIRVFAALAWFVIAAIPLAASPQSEGYKRLGSAQIRQAFAGKTFSDDTHFSFAYKADGTIRGMSMGKTVTSRWALIKDELCVTDRFGEACYGVWKKGAAIRLMIGASDVTIDGALR